MYKDGYITPSVYVPQARRETSGKWWAKDQMQNRFKNWGVTEIKPPPEDGFVESIFSGRRKYFAVSLYVPDAETGAYVWQQMDDLRSSADLFESFNIIALGAAMCSHQPTMMRCLTARSQRSGLSVLSLTEACSMWACPTWDRVLLRRRTLTMSVTLCGLQCDRAAEARLRVRLQVVD
eukprot:CAMPEP_0117515768 /NCGR_PEP_ID=MMETSP0784-20121206/30751_1 /TAXON_ID=39447 /ORGANISM="" /LENGTH=177 /DNA_ID=CAMNT_0005311597 /DNA_START=1 /DNA_END=535 /DNA_ORIENTATION=-